MPCKVKHTKYQTSPDEPLCCPKCGNNESFFIDFPANDVDEDCTLIHTDDFIRCHKCGFETTGKQHMQYLARKNNIVPCPHCKGKGYVKKEKV